MTEQDGQESQSLPTGHCSAGSEDMNCDFCIGKKRKATKFCVQCQAYSCEEHLQPHYEVPPLKKHKLLEPSTNPQKIFCSRHDEMKKIFCRTDQQCICYLCSIDEHKGHNTVSAQVETEKRQKEVQVSQQNLKQRIKEGETRLKVLQQEVDAINCSAKKAVGDIDMMSTELVQLIQKKSSEVKQQITSQQEIEVRRVEDLKENVEKELAELRRKDTELEQLSHTTNEIMFLQNCPSLSPLSKSTGSVRFNGRTPQYYKDVITAVSEAREKLRKLSIMKWNNISKTVIEVDVLLPQDPKTKDDLSRFSLPLTLDPNTANAELSLYERKTKATSVTGQFHFYSDDSDRFVTKVQVLSTECLTGRCYWEVEWSGLGVLVAVAYKNISRAGDVSGFGNNDKSWVLECSRAISDTPYKFKHNNDRVPVTGPLSSRVGVFLDHRAGVLSFYSVSETVTLLHKVQTKFKHPLYAGLCVHFKGATAKICSPGKN